jgi:murein DD-endopeptidase MepM/ murein hydrolase activator NlpD
VRTIRPAQLPAISEPAEVRTIRLGERSVRVVRVAKGDTLMKILVREGVPREEADAAITALKRVFDPRKLKAGQEVALRFAPRLGVEGGKGALQAIRLAPDVEQEVGVDRRGPVFTAIEGRPHVTVEAVRTGGTIKTSLYKAAQAAGVPPEVLVELISAFSFDVDFQRDLQPGDSFEVVFERRVNGDRSAAKPGDILYATLALSGEAISIYRYAPDGKDFDYFNQKGESVRKALLRTPIDGARLSSRFGKRKHPVLGYTRMHRGIDFAAPKGTPIVAAGDGSVAKAGRNGNYGNYVEVRHNGEFSTAYAHLSRFAKGVRQGRRVRQGQVIGYVGSTGLSTGPHLHFEVIRNDKKINPLAVKLPSGRKLKGSDLEQFLAARAEIDRKLAGLPLDTEVASKR